MEEFFYNLGHFIVLLWFLLLNVYLFVTAPQMGEKNRIIERLQRQLESQSNHLNSYKDALDSFDFRTDSIASLKEKLNPK